jgi:6-phosphogluconolactonase
MEGSHMMPQNLILVNRHDTFAEIVAERVAGKIAETIAARRRCTLALAGGETPRPIYECLSRPDPKQRVEWDKLEFYFGDERCVSPTDPDSNYRMVRESLFARAPIAPGQVNRIEAERDDRDQAAAEYEARLPQRLDLLLLGMGTDGHTASLFPGSPALDEQEHRVLVVSGPKPRSCRITITPSVIASARQTLVLISGKDKAPMVARALREPCNPKKLPIQLALQGTWILDSSAAEQLVRSEK